MAKTQPLLSNLRECAVIWDHQVKIVLFHTVQVGTDVPPNLGDPDYNLLPVLGLSCAANGEPRIVNQRVRRVFLKSYIDPAIELVSDVSKGPSEGASAAPVPHRLFGC